jgi:glyoxylase I family protein
MQSTNTIIKGCGFHHVATKVADFEAAVKFYVEGLGLIKKLEWGEGDGRAVMLDLGDGGCLELFAGGTDRDKPEGALLHLAMRADDCDAALQCAVAAGAVVTMAPTDVMIPSRPTPTPVCIAFCRTPSGEILEFFQSATC